MRILFFLEWLMQNKRESIMKDLEEKILNTTLGIRRKIVLIRQYQRQLIPDALETSEEICARIIKRNTITQ
jgi:hypothetical protein